VLCFVEVGVQLLDMGRTVGVKLEHLVTIPLNIASMVTMETGQSVNVVWVSLAKLFVSHLQMVIS
jgi:hypothetical protein